jgi:hypothetical protein
LITATLQYHSQYSLLVDSRLWSINNHNNNHNKHQPLSRSLSFWRLLQFDSYSIRTTLAAVLDDMARCIHLKCYFNDECHKTDIDRPMARNELESLLSYNFGFPVEIEKYQDHEGDWVTVNSYRDLEVAFYEYRCLETNQPSNLHTLKFALRRSSNSFIGAGGGGLGMPLSLSHGGGGGGGSSGYTSTVTGIGSSSGSGSFISTSNHASEPDLLQHNSNTLFASPSSPSSSASTSVNMNYLAFHTASSFRPSSPVITKHVSISDWRSSLDHKVDNPFSNNSPIGTSLLSSIGNGIGSSSTNLNSSSSSSGSGSGSGSSSQAYFPEPRPRSNSTASMRSSFISKVLPITEHHLDGERVRHNSSNSGEIFPPPLRTPPPSPGRPSPTNLLLSDLSFSPSRDSPLATRRGSRDIGRASTPLLSTPKRNLTGQDLWKKGTELLGKGGFGKVYLGLLQTGELIAVKEMELLALPDTDYQVSHHYQPPTAHRPPLD